MRHSGDIFNLSYGTTFGTTQGRGIPRDIYSINSISRQANGGTLAARALSSTTDAPVSRYHGTTLGRSRSSSDNHLPRRGQNTLGQGLNHDFLTAVIDNGVFLKGYLHNRLKRVAMDGRSTGLCHYGRFKLIRCRCLR